MDTRKPLDGQAVGLMVLVCAALGLQQVALKATAQDISPVLQIGLRSGLAAVLIAGVMLFRREGPRRGDGLVWPGLAAGALFALEFLVLGEALRLTSAAHGVVFLYTAPLFTALALHVLIPAERLSPAQWGGIVLAFSGIAAAFLGSGGVDGGSDMLLGDALAVLAGAAWGGTTVVIRVTRLAQAPARLTLLYQLVVACVVLVTAAAVMGQMQVTVTPLVMGSLLYQALVVSFAAFMVWFWLLRRYLASRLGVLSFMTPLFGVAAGAVVLGEPVEPAFGFGAAMVMAGILVVMKGGRNRAVTPVSNTVSSGQPTPAPARMASAD